MSDASGADRVIGLRRPDVTEVAGAVAVRHDPASAAVVRRLLADELTSHAICRDSIDDVVLVASELVGNAVVHTEAVAELGIGWQVEGPTVLVWVQDACTRTPTPRQATPDATNGRGLAIVAAVAQDWGIEPVSSGKKVWARVPVTAA